MRATLLGVICFLSGGLQSLEYEVEFENELVCVAHAKILPYEEIEPHRDVYPHMVIALRGGLIRRLEADGTINDVEFPTGVPIFRTADSGDALHRSVSCSSELIELQIIHFKL